MAFSTMQSEKCDFRITPIFNDLASLKMAVYPERMDARVKFCRMDSAKNRVLVIIYRTSSLLKNSVFQQAASAFPEKRIRQGGTVVNAGNIGWNGNLSPGQSASFGFQGNQDGSFLQPTCSAN
jgi:hypothetical protein